ncbi:hypothetical protein EON65_38410 [archaeon]|nr:MAG: hypothetical protein EON65_38410 [archaeon]
MKSSLPAQKEKEKQREGKWVSNFQVNNALDPPKHQKRMRHKSNHSYQRTVSPDNGDNSGQSGQTMPLEMTEEEQEAEKKMATKRRTLNEGLATDELILLGMYRFTPEQEETYQKFVEMLAGFDKFDMVSFMLNNT